MELLTLFGRPRPTRKMLAEVAYYIGVVAICVPFVFVFYWMVLGGL